MIDPFFGLTYFKKESSIDHWGDPKKMQKPLLEELDKFRHHIGKPIYVTSAYRSSSSGSSDSEHFRGNAVDIVVPDFKGRILDLYIEATRFDFRGIGVYRDWYFGDPKNVVGGLHLDRRPGPTARWFCYKGQDGLQQYKALTVANLKYYGVV